MFYWGILIGVIIGANVGVVISAMFFLAKMKERLLLSTEDSSEDNVPDEQVLSESFG
jgi:hypothetical protein